MLELRDIHKTYEGLPLLRGISFSVEAHETICLAGPSGSGKSTLLRIIAGLESFESGTVLWDGQDIRFTPPHLRDFGLVFQDYALFPHLDVFDNTAFGLKMKNWPGDQTQARVDEVLDLVNMKGFENRKVAELSGGEQQRVALARALAPRPRLLLFDEPLGALDRALKENVLGELRSILHRTGIPAIYVTHDQEEASAIADRVLLLHEGQIVQQGPTAEIWAKPNSVWVAEFLGLGNILEGRIAGGKWEVKTKFGVFNINCAHRHKVGEQVRLLARPLSASNAANVIRGRVVDVVFQQDRFKVVLDNGLYFQLEDAPKPGQELEVGIRLECLG
jgi:spermidine/putrescine transport system ATP-binding protein